MKTTGIKCLLTIFVLAISLGCVTASLAASTEQHLKVGVVGDPHNWDPMDTYRLDWSAIATSVFEGLVERDLKAEIKPGLATSWDIDQAEKKIRFHLRKGVKFHNGDDFKADSVKYTFDRLLAPESKSPQKGNYSAIKEVKIVDDYTVDFLLNEIDAVLIVKLSGYAGVIVPKGYIEAKGDAHFNDHPVGTGPFKMTQYVPDQTVVLERFDDYWKQPLPTLDKVTFRVIPEASTRLAELQTHTIDISNKVEINQVSAVQNSPRVDVVKADTPSVYALRFDVLRKPVDDVRVREALALAIDMDTIVDTVLQGNARRINSFQSKLSFGYDDTIPVRPYDPKKAKQLLEAANYDFNQTLTLTTSASDTTFKEVTQAVQLYLKQIGIKTKLETVEFNVFINDMVPNRKAGHLFRQGWGGWTLDFDNTAYSLYHFGSKWCPDYNDKVVEQLLTEERTTMDQGIRKAAFTKMTHRLNETLPDIPLYQKVDLWGVNQRVKGFVAPVDGRMRFENVSIGE